MPPFSGNFPSDAELLIGVKKGLFNRSRVLSLEATFAAVHDLKEWATDEVAFEESASASFGRILSELWHSEYLDQLPPLFNRFERLASAYFVRRGSAPAFHGFCSAWREGVLRRILQFAEEGPELNDQGQVLVPYALLASGCAGRREQTLEEGHRYFLVWSQGDAGYQQQFAYRIIAILDRCGLLGKENSGYLGRSLWRGSLEDWDEFVNGGPGAGEQSNRLELLADMRHICGDEAIGRMAARLARTGLECSRRDGAQFLKLARQVVEAPVALGLLGDIRVERSGEQVGCCDPEQAGLYPLVGAVRLLAAQHDLDPAPTLDRITALGSLAVLDQELVRSLTASYHVLAGLQIKHEIALEPSWLNPASLNSNERQKLKKSFQAVRDLQLLVARIFGIRCRNNWWGLRTNP